MTDNEIIKRLERCVKRGNRNYDTDIVLDLINRQKAEIDELKHERKVLIEDIHHSTDKINEQFEEIEKLERTISYLEGVCESTPDKVRTEAIKEFAEHLKERWSNNYYDSPDVDFDEFVDNLLKEIVDE